MRREGLAVRACDVVRYGWCREGEPGVMERVVFAAVSMRIWISRVCVLLFCIGEVGAASGECDTMAAAEPGVVTGLAAVAVVMRCQRLAVAFHCVSNRCGSGADEAPTERGEGGSGTSKSNVRAANTCEVARTCEGLR